MRLWGHAAYGAAGPTAYSVCPCGRVQSRGLVSDGEVTSDLNEAEVGLTRSEGIDP